MHAAHGLAYFVGLGALGLFNGSLVEEKHPVAVRAIQVRLSLVGSFELGYEFLVLGCIEVGRIAHTGDESIACLANGGQVLRGHCARSAHHLHIAIEAKFRHLGEQAYRVVAGYRGVDHRGPSSTHLAEEG